VIDCVHCTNFCLSDISGRNECVRFRKSRISPSQQCPGSFLQSGVIDGGAGTDTCVFTGLYSSYTISYNAATLSYRVVDSSGVADTVAGGLAYWRGKLLDGSASHGSLVIDVLYAAHTRSR
jgi:hypothetical protein